MTEEVEVNPGGSKKIFIKRNRPFIHEQLHSTEAREYLSLSKRSIGSYYATANSRRQGTGLTDDELKILIPQIIDVRPDDQNFRKEVAKFYQEISTLIPYERGLELEIGLELDNSKPVSHYVIKTEDGKEKKVYNMPLVPEDYVRYRHAAGDPTQNVKGHPHVANSPEEAKGNQTISYYIEDPTKVVSARIKTLDFADEAMSLYQIIKNEPKKIVMVLSLLRDLIPKNHIGQVIIVENMEADEQKLAIREIAVKHPARFHRVATDENLQSKYKLAQLISADLIHRAGSSILIKESGEPLGSNEDEAIKNLFKDPAKGPLLAILKGKLDDWKLKQRIGVK